MNPTRAQSRRTPREAVPRTPKGSPRARALLPSGRSRAAPRPATTIAALAIATVLRRASAPLRVQRSRAQSPTAAEFSHSAPTRSVPEANLSSGRAGSGVSLVRKRPIRSVRWSRVRSVPSRSPKFQESRTTITTAIPPPRTSQSRGAVRRRSTSARSKLFPAVSATRFRRVPRFRRSRNRAPTTSTATTTITNA